MRTIFNSFFRNIGRILAYLVFIIIIYLLMLLLGVEPKNLLSDNVYALNSGYTSGQYYVAFQDCGNMSNNTSCAAGFGSWFGPSNYGTAIQNPHSQNSSTYPFFYNQTRYQFRFSGGSTYTYKKGNEYNVKIKFRTSSNNFNALSTFWKVDHIFGSTTGSNSSQNETYVKLISYILTEDNDISTTNTYILDVKFIPTRDINYFSIYYSLIDTSSRFITAYGFGGNMITYANIPITYVEDADIAVKDAINSQTDAMNKGFTEIENIINNGNNAMINSQNETNDLIKDDSIDSNQATSYFTDFSQNTYGIQDIINVPLHYIQRLTTETCQPLNFTLPFVKTNVSLPCMTEIYRTYFNDWFAVYQTLMLGVVCYGVGIKIMREVRDALNPMSTGRVELIKL